MEGNRMTQEGLLQLKSLDSPHVEAGGLQPQTATPFPSAKNSKRSRRFTRARHNGTTVGGANAARSGNLNGLSYG